MEIKKVIEKLNGGKIGIIPTDTIYGLVGKALDKSVVERIYEVKGREETKPFIILINSLNDLKTFNIWLTEKELNYLSKVWPDEVSVILNCNSSNYQYLHRGLKTLAFRMPNNKLLTSILNKTGPLVAPSANTSGKEPSNTIEEAKKYFGTNVDFYFDKGRLESMPSTLISINNDNVKVLRQGKVKIKVD